MARALVPDRIDQSRTSPLPPPVVLVFGAGAVDLTSSTSTMPTPRSTTPGTIFVSSGGVGRNIAEAAQNLLPPSSVKMVSAHGTSDSARKPDPLGVLLLDELRRTGLRTDGMHASGSGERTAACNLLLDQDGDLVSGVADMEIVETLSPRFVSTTLGMSSAC